MHFEVLVTSGRLRAGVNLPFHFVSDELHSSGNRFRINGPRVV